MKKLIVEEVNSFRAEVRAHARVAGQIKRQDRFVTLSGMKCFVLKLLFDPPSLPIPSRDDIINSPVQEHGPVHGATSGYTAPNRRASSPLMEDPSDQLERELAGTHLAGKQ